MIDRIFALDVTLLAIQQSDVIAAATLPSHHLDPFDRMLIAQAHAYGITMITADSDIAKYDIPILWR